MLDLFKEFATDLEAEVNGKWVKYAGAEFLIARAYNKNFVDAFKQEVEKNKAKMDKLEGEEADDLSRQIFATVLADTILLDWKGDIGFKGHPMKYSKANAKAILSDKSMRDFVEFISKESQDIDNFRAEIEKEQEKN